MSEWRTVPVEPTTGMVCNAIGDLTADQVRKCYKAMLAAAPRPDDELPEFLQMPTPQAIEVFRSSFENHTGDLPFDGRLIPNQWLLRERGITEKVAADLERPDDELARLEREIARNEVLSWFEKGLWHRIDPQEADWSVSRYGILSGLLEHHPTEPDLVRVKESE